MKSHSNDRITVGMDAQRSLKRATLESRSSSSKKTIVAIMLLIMTSIIVMQLRHKLGWKSNPAAPEEIILHDPEARRTLSCLRELFRARVHNNSTPDWANENCPTELIDGIETSDDPLRTIVATRNHLFAKSGLPQGLIEWRESHPAEGVAEMKTRIDKTKFRQALEAGLITLGKGFNPRMLQ